MAAIEEYSRESVLLSKMTAGRSELAPKIRPRR
jgi:hypothetical protein